MYQEIRDSSILTSRLVVKADQVEEKPVISSLVCTVVKTAFRYPQQQCMLEE